MTLTNRRQTPQLQLSMTETESRPLNGGNTDLSSSPISSISIHSHSSVLYVDPVTGQRKVVVLPGVWMDADQPVQLVLSPPPSHWRRRLEDTEEHDTFAGESA